MTTKKKKVVVIDVNPVVPMYVKGWCSGIGKATYQLVLALDRYANGHELPFEIVLYSQNMKGIGGRNMGTSFRCVHLYLPFRKLVNKVIAKLHLLRLVLGNYDLFHVTHNFEYVENKRKTVVTIHDVLSFHYPIEYSNDYLDLCMDLANGCRHVITCSESSRQDIIKYLKVLPENVTTIYWGKEFCEVTQQKKEDFFLTLSCSMFRKNTMSAIYAFKSYKIKYPQSGSKLYIIWANPPEPIKMLCREEVKSGSIVFLDNLEEQEVIALYSKARATLFLSLYEGFGLPILESMACGTPVITCRNSSLIEVGGDAAIYVDPYDIEQIASEMARLTIDGKEYKELQNKCLAQSQNFSWDTCAEQTVEVYKRLLMLN